MPLKKLLTVEDTFLIRGRGLVVTPLLAAPREDLKFKAFSQKAVVRRPDGSEQQFDAQFKLEHFLLVDGRSRWSVIALLPAAGKQDVPIGSTLLVDEEALQRLGRADV